MRLFVAIPFSQAVREELLAAERMLRRTGSGSFARSENLHLTLAFLGETEAAARAQAALTESVKGTSFPIRLAGTGHFGDLWWAGLADSPRLTALAMDVQAALRRQGFAIEKRPWKPHVTLVRRYRGRQPDFTVSPVEMDVEKVSLMRSDQIDGRRVYTELAAYPLDKVHPAG